MTMNNVLDFELNEQERQEINVITKEMGGILSAFLNNTGEISMKQFEEWRARFNEIYSTAHPRSLEYFSKHPSELIGKLKEGTRSHVCFIAELESSQDQNFAKNNIVQYINDIAPYLEILKDKAPESYNEIVKCIDYDFHHRKNIYEKEKQKPAVRTRTRRTEELILDRTKVNNAIRKGRKELYETKGVLVESAKTRNKSNPRPVYTLVRLNYILEELENQGLSVNVIGQLENVDMIIAMHIDSLYYAGNKKVTYDMIATQMAGGRRTQATPKFRELINKSLLRLRLTNITINTEAEQKAGYNKRISFSGVVLPNKIISEPLILNNKRLEEYIYILDHSVLSEYADSKNQISRPPVALLDVHVSLTKDNILLTDYLMRRIIRMQSPVPEKGKYIILYESVFEYLGIEGKDNTSLIKKKRIRETVRKILKAWKKKGFIQDFQELGDDNKPHKSPSRAPIAKIKITLPPKQDKQEETKSIARKNQ